MKVCTAGASFFAGHWLVRVLVTGHEIIAAPGFATPAQYIEVQHPAAGDAGVKLA